LRLELKGDLDAILSKALRKESCKRYQTCESLMDDITRFRSNLPVNAHQGSYSYRAEKFLKRNYKSLSAIAAIMIISVLFSLYHTNRITEERNLAQFEAERTAEVTSMLYDLFEANEPEQTLGDTITAHELLQRGLERAESMHGQPELQAQTFNVIGRIYLKLGNLQKAEPILADAVDIMENLYGPNHSDTAEAYASLASILSAQGQYPEAEAIFNHSIEILESYSVLKASVLSSAMTEIAYVLRRQGKYSEAEEAYRRNVERFSEQYGENHPKTISAENGLGVTVFNQGNYSEAEKIFSSVLNKRIQLFGDTHPDVAESKNSLGALYMNLGRFRESEQLFQEALFLRNRILGPRHPKTLLTLNNLAINQRDNGKFDLSGKTFQRVIEYKEELFGPYSVASAISYFSYGELKLLTQLPNEAIYNFEKALPVFEDFLGKQHSFSARTRMNIGYAYLISGNRNLAKNYLEDGYEQVAKIHETNTLERAIADHQMGSYHMHRGDYQQAYELIHQSFRAFTSLESSVSARHRQVINDLNRISQYASAE
jgi:eukaryotic-like serine/threonine-protein kinase